MTISLRDVERCFSVVNTNKDLIGMLKYVSENISFWEELKKSQGSLEEGALMQLDKICLFWHIHYLNTYHVQPN